MLPLKYLIKHSENPFPLKVRIVKSRLFVRDVCGTIVNYTISLNQKHTPNFTCSTGIFIHDVLQEWPFENWIFKPLHSNKIEKYVNLNGYVKYKK